MKVESSFSSSYAPAARPKKINLYFLCEQEPDEVALLYGRRPEGPPAPRGIFRFEESMRAHIKQADGDVSAIK